ncbi:prolyl oligopeptidase family serine peptidase [Streptomyces sp. H34-S4]|uniref:prolyl oligopeptidase family serine peptidase n=1 Tax=Streptomyces sp. H34-S4 TaxID=2996463 RepID=UPI00226E87F8|nr:prolyl oligopeptidase family serine peptidase [Streptomyces sp. H34-S4]MCY0933940.1 prolyl oligopeptidase family serine peptidase [Streptomyces sp. H34-S4]
MSGAPPTDLTGHLDRSVLFAALGDTYARSSGEHGQSETLVLVRDEGRVHLHGVGVDSGTCRVLLGGADRSVTEASRAQEAGTVAVVLATAVSFGEIAVVDPADASCRTVTAHGAEALPDVRIFPPQERRFTATDGTAVHGWVIGDPRAIQPGPLLVDIHGGPHTAWSGTADPARVYQQVLAARGWTVLMVNPRGSDGYGETFYRAVTGGWGREDAGDLLDALDELVQDGIADPGRLAVTGYSYGGYLTCYLTSRDRRFAAAVAGGTVSDLVSMVGTSDTGSMVGELELGGAPWTSPDRYAASNPMARVGEVRTPTLLLHGASDLRCPAGQARQWFAALRNLRVPTRLVLYPDASHSFVWDGRPSHRADWNQRIVAWIEQYTP